MKYLYIQNAGAAEKKMNLFICGGIAVIKKSFELISISIERT